MNKKATSVLFIVFEIIIVVTIIGLSLFFAKNLGESETIAKTNLANNLKMMVETLVAVPGSAVAEYPSPNNVSKYKIMLNSGQVEIFEKAKPEVKSIDRKFFLPQGYLTVGKLDGEKSLCLLKEKKTITLDKCP